MRCKNCGWDNPDGNVKCEKCNAPLNYFMEQEPIPENEYVQSEYVQSEYVARATVAGIAAPADDFNPRATVIGCVACGYPIRPNDTECPVCGHAVSGAKKEPGAEKPEAQKPFPVGTIIQGRSAEKEKTDRERKKLTGFLVTYSSSPNGEFFPLYEGKNSVGRLPSSNVFIKGDSAVSEKHLSILYRAVDRKFKFKDEQSSNGTFVNEELEDEGELKNLDKIRIGNTLLVFMEIPLSAFE